MLCKGIFVHGHNPTIQILSPKYLTTGICHAPVTKEEFFPLSFCQDAGTRCIKYLHNAGQLLCLVLSREERVTRVQLRQNGAKTPHVNSHAVRETFKAKHTPINHTHPLGVPRIVGSRTENDLGGSVEPGLDVRVDALVIIATRTKINDLNLTLSTQFQQDVLLEMQNGSNVPYGATWVIKTHDKSDTRCLTTDY